MEIKDIDLRKLIEEETGLKFNRSNKINSPFNPLDKNPSFAIFFDANAGKMKFKDFSTGKTGDACDFIMKYKNIDYYESRKYLGLETELSETEKFENKINNYAEWEISKGNKKGFKILGIFTFVDENNNPIYCKVKFNRPDGSKLTPY